MSESIRTDDFRQINKEREEWNRVYKKQVREINEIDNQTIKLERMLDNALESTSLHDQRLISIIEENKNILSNIHKKHQNGLDLLEIINKNKKEKFNEKEQKVKDSSGVNNNKDE